MPRHGENIYRRKDGRYEGRYVIGRGPSGKTRFGYVYARTYGEVRERLIRKKAAHLPGQRRPQITLGDFMRRWMATEVVGRVRPSTRQIYQTLLEKHLLPRLGHWPIEEITPVMVRAFVADLSAGTLADSTVRGIFRLLSAGMRCAQEDGLIPQNPCRRIRLGPPRRTEQRVLTQREMRALAAVASLNMQPAKAADDALPLLLALQTGMRLGEVCALRWEDVRWDQGCIAVGRTAQRLMAASGGRSRTQLLVGPTKSGASRRLLPLPGTLLDALRTRKAQTASAAYIFGTNDAPAEPRTIQRHTERLMRRAGVTGAHFHTLRHTFATRMIELGVDVKTVSVLLGHASSRITLDFYAHSLPDSQRAAIEKLSRSL